MDNVKKVAVICKYNLQMLFQGSRMYMIGISILFLSLVTLRPLSEYAALHKETIHIFEIFPNYCSSKISVLFLVFGLVLLFCDAPFLQEGTVYLLVRGSKKLYILGQTMFILCVSILYFLWVQVCIVVSISPNIGMGNTWSKPIEMASRNLSSVGIKIDIVFFPEILFESTPLQQFLRSFLCMVLLGVFVGLLILTINLYTSSMMGNAVLAILLVFDYGLHGLELVDGIGYWSPISMARISLQNLGYAPQFPSLWYVLLFYLGSATLFVGLLLYKVREVDLNPRGVKA